MTNFRGVLFLTIVSLSLVWGLELTGDADENGYKVYNIKGQLHMKCTADEVVDIVWFKNDSEIKSDDHYEISQTKDKKHSKTTSDLHIKKALNDDTGDYSCRVVKENKMAKFMAVANVAVKLPANFAVVEGEKLRLHCIAVGYKPVINWILPDNVTIEDGSIDSQDSRITVEGEGDIEGNVLIIDPAEKRDRGEYICEGRSKDEILFRESAKGNKMTTKSFVRVKDKLAALFPFIGIVTEVVLLCAIILFYEKRNSKPMEMDDSDNEQSPEQKKGDVRHRK
ncbi:basigin-like [Culicoides brevitarsis]|uniref:basigin-like n=1 Tax=Culicoides brevitarsis TaxID=469753 RepID=UPI00307B53F9